MTSMPSTKDAEQAVNIADVILDDPIELIATTSVKAVVGERLPPMQHSRNPNITAVTSLHVKGHRDTRDRRISERLGRTPKGERNIGNHLDLVAERSDLPHPAEIDHIVHFPNLDILTEANPGVHPTAKGVSTDMDGDHPRVTMTVNTAEVTVGVATAAEAPDLAAVIHHRDPTRLGKLVDPHLQGVHPVLRMGANEDETILRVERDADEGCVRNSYRAVAVELPANASTITHRS